MPKVFFIITGDPRSSHRPAEALRIAAGVGAWQKATVSLYFRGKAVLALSECPDDFLDADHFSRYLPLVAEWGRPIYVQSGLLAWVNGPGATPLPYQEITDAELAHITAQQDYVLRF